MKRLHRLSLLLLASLISPLVIAQQTIELPAPQLKGTGGLPEALQARRSVRHYSNSPLSLAEIGQLAWAAQGITHEQGYRTAPSAGALYPLELYVIANRVSGLPPGLYHYLPAKHTLQQLSEQNLQTKLAIAAYNQRALRKAAAIFIIAGVKQRTAHKYRGRAERYVYIEAGHAGQNLLLQATALGLGSVIIGAFIDNTVSEVLGLGEGEQPISLLAVGKRE